MISDSIAMAFVAGALALLALAALGWKWRRVRGTTLLAAWWWSVGCVLSIATVEMAAALGADQSASWIGPARFAAAMTALCPAMAVLGAKRPQDRAWQFVVVTLLAVLSMPSLEWMFLGDMSEIHPARIAFLAILIAIATLNGLATRFWPSSLLTCFAQMALIAPHLTFSFGWLPGAWGPLTGLALLAAAWDLIDLDVPRSLPTGAPLDRVWLDFRDRYGAVWSLRIMQRMNASAAMYDWPVVLAWRGFVSRSDGTPVENVPPLVEESLRTLLRRFVSQAWIDTRMIRDGATEATRRSGYKR